MEEMTFKVAAAVGMVKDESMQDVRTLGVVYTVSLGLDAVTVENMRDLEGLGTVASDPNDNVRED